jgi:D-arabinose 1-dehydrogenase-like Zn-dependent alcohol dehydrogenase
MDWYIGSSIDLQDTFTFSPDSTVKSMSEVYPLERASEAYELMMSGKARFRSDPTTGN